MAIVNEPYTTPSIGWIARTTAPVRGLWQGYAVTKCTANVDQLSRTPAAGGRPAAVTWHKIGRTEAGHETKAKIPTTRGVRINRG
jgi:hypothetical protein